LNKLEPRATSSGVIDQLPDVMPSRQNVYQRLRAAGVAMENAMATHMDDAVGAILKRLDELDVRENTLVLFISDHGTRGKNSCFESAARVPAIVAWPGRITPGSRMASLTGNLDIAATLIDAAGGKVPKEITQDSRSLLPQLLGQPQAPDRRESLLLEMGNTKAVVGERWKYIANRVPPHIEVKMNDDAQRAAESGTPRTVFWSGVDHHSYGAEVDFPNYYDADQLYDIVNDPYEMINLAGDPQRAEVLAEMKEHLRDLISTLPHGFGEFKAVTKEAAKLKNR
jgi:arylsulfatase A-like enzyme